MVNKFRCNFFNIMIVNIIVQIADELKNELLQKHELKIIK